METLTDLIGLTRGVNNGQVQVALFTSAPRLILRLPGTFLDLDGLVEVKSMGTSAPGSISPAGSTATNLVAFALFESEKERIFAGVVQRERLLELRIVLLVGAYEAKVQRGDLLLARADRRGLDVLA